MTYRKKLPNYQRKSVYGFLRYLGYSPSGASRIRDFSKNKINQVILNTIKEGKIIRELER